MNEEYDYMEGFGGLVYTRPTVPSYYGYMTIPLNKLSYEQLEFLKRTLMFSNKRGDVDFEKDSYLISGIYYTPDIWFTCPYLGDYDKEISFNDIFKHKEK